MQNSASRILDIIFEALYFCLSSTSSIVLIYDNNGLIESSGYIDCGGSFNIDGCGAANRASGGVNSGVDSGVENYYNSDEVNSNLFYSYLKIILSF